MTPSEPELGMRLALRADLRQFATYSAGLMRQRTGWVRTISLLLSPPMLCCLLHRIAHACHRRNWHVLARVASRINHVVHRVDIDPGSMIGPGLYIPHPVGVVFHGHAGAGLTLYSRAVVVPAGHGRGVVNAPQLGNEVTVGVNAVVSGPVRIGHRAFVGSNAAIARDVPDRAYVLERPQQRTMRPG
jgi:serine O-acetyltransferase